MIDWNLVAKITGGGFGVAILVLLILALVTWLVGLGLQRIPAKSKEKSVKDSR